MLEPIPKKDGENANTWFVEYCHKVKNDTLEIHKMLNSNEYLEWLVNFSKAITSLSDKYISTLGSYSSIDIDHISRLKYLYEAVRMYADKSYIVPDEYENSYVYYLVYQGLIFRIGKMLNESDVYTYTKVDSVPADTQVISFTDMQEDKNVLQNDSIKESLVELSNYIKQLLNNGIPEEEILKTTEETINMNLKKKD